MKKVVMWALALGAMQTGLAGAGTGVLAPTDSYENGEYLFWDQQITKGCGYKTKFQRDGNLVTYDGYNQAVWNTGTWDWGAGYVHITSRGKLLVRNWFDQVLWASPNEEWTCSEPTLRYCKGAKLEQQDNGNLRILYNFAGNDNVLWQSNRAGLTHYGNCQMVPEKVTQVRYNQDLWGGDYKSVVLSEPRPSWCGGYCALENGACKAYTYVPPGVHGPNAVCYLKNTVPAPTSRSGMVSGVIITRY